MMTIVAVLSALLAGSVGLNFYLYRQKKLAEKTPTYDARKLFRDLMAGSTLLKIEVINPEGILLWRGGK